MARTKHRAPESRDPYHSSDIEVALQSMKSDLELTLDEKAQASYYQQLVREKLSGTLDGFQTSFLTGSYIRGTAIAPLKDIDIFVVLDPACRRDLLENGPSRCINAVRAAADDALTRLHKSPFAQRRSVGIVFASADLKVELVPAFQTNREEVFIIADRSKVGWLLTAPQTHAHLSTIANERSGGFLKPVIKMLKAWKRECRIPLKSFHLEVMCYEAMVAPPPSLSVALGVTLHHLVAAIQRSCPDPAGIGADIDSDLSMENRMVAKTALEQAFYIASEALRQEHDCMVASHNRWKDIFGDLYPRDYWRQRRS